MPQKKALELEIAKLKKQIELAGVSLSIEDIAKILQDIEDKREEEREQFLQNKKVQENLTPEEKNDLKKKFRYISRLVHPDTTNLDKIDPKYLILLTEFKDAGALDVLTQIYENIEVRGQSIEEAFSKYLGENDDNKTVSDTRLNIVRVQNEIIKYSKLKEMLQQIRGSDERIEGISKQLDVELDALRVEKVELEKVLERLKVEDVEQPEDAISSIVTVKNEVNSEQLEQSGGELSLENQIKKHLRVDLDELYGDGTTEANNRDSRVSATYTENKLEKRNIWNPTNFEETMEAVKELEKILKTLPGVTYNGYTFTIHSPAQDAQINFQNYHNSYTDACGIFFKSKDLNIDLIKIQKQNSDPLYMFVSSKFEVMDGLKSASNALPDTNGPKTFMVLKNKLKEFGIDLDAM
jgi:hypothetical protein